MQVFQTGRGFPLVIHGFPPPPGSGPSVLRASGTDTVRRPPRAVVFDGQINVQQDVFTKMRIVKKLGRNRHMQCSQRHGGDRSTSGLHDFHDFADDR